MAKDAVASHLLKPKAERGRNLFPLDNRQVYSIKAGQINPVKAIHFIPGDYFDITAHDFSMTFPMNTAAFLRGRKETAFYSVYYNAIWSLFNQYMAGRNDDKTSAFGFKPKLEEPRIAQMQLYADVFIQFVYYVVGKYWLRAKVVNSGLFESQIDSGLYTLDQIMSDVERVYLNQTGVSNSNCLDFNVSYTMGQTTANWHFALALSLPSGVFDFRGIRYADIEAGSGVVGDFCLDICRHYRVFNHVRKLDMLGYGNLYPILKYYESQIEKISSAIKDTSASWQTYTLQLNTIFDNLYKRLCSFCYTWQQDFSNPVNLSPLYVNLYSICAYNSIFYHFFRNSYYDVNYFVNDYSLDFVSVASRNFNIVSINEFSSRFLDIEYHQWKKDVFTSVLPDTQFGAVSSISVNFNVSSFVLTNPDTNRWTPSANSPIAVVQSGSSLAQNGTSPNPVSHTHSIPPSYLNRGLSANSLDVISLKRAEMLQQYRQTLLRAGNKTTDVFRAIYGGSPSSEHVDDIIPRFLETFGEDIFVDPVIATADTGSEVNGRLGDLSARGKFRGDSRSIKFNAGYNYGVILCLTYLVPEAEYNSYLLDKHNLELSPEAHFLPAYENFGLEPIYTDELNMLYPRNQMNTLGFSSRYYHKKMALDLIHGAFCSLPSTLLKDLAPEGTFFPNILTDSWFGDFNHWVSPRSDMQASPVSALRFFYINPSVLDNVFVRAVSPDIADDQLLCNTYFVIKATRQLTKNGLINFV